MKHGQKHFLFLTFSDGRLHGFKRFGFWQKLKREEKTDEKTVER